MTNTLETALLGVLDEILTEVKELNARLGQATNASSVEVATSTRGHDITVKLYANSPLGATGDSPAAEYLRLKAEMEARLMDGFEKTARKAGV